jgi:hypothetical protein
MNQNPRDRRHGWDPDYTGPERRDHSHDLHNQNLRRFQEIEAQLAKGGRRMEAIERELRDNTSVTREVRELMELGRSGFKVLGWLGVAAKWVGSLAAAAAAVWALVYAATHGGKPPGT